ncbi:MAG: Ig-like domain-containing protein [Gemmatimonadota bacterium]
MRIRFSPARRALRGALPACALVLALSSCRSDALGPTFDLEQPVSGDLVVHPEELALGDGETGFLRPVLRTLTGQELGSFPNDKNIKWTVEYPAIASVSAGGVVSAKIPGETRVFAELNGQQAVALVAVRPKPDKLRPMLEVVHQGVIGATLADSVGVFLMDGGGLPVANTQVRFTIEAGGGAVSPRVATTDASGRVAFAWRLGSSVGLQAVRVDADGVPSIYLQAEAERTSDGLRLEIVRGDQQEGEVDALLQEPLVVRVVDEQGRVVANQPVTWEFTQGSAGSAAAAASPAGVPLTMAQNTTAAGTSEVQWKLGAAAGEQRAVARLANGNTVWFDAKAQAGLIDRIVTTPRQLEVDVGRTIQFQAKAYDGFGNVIPNASLNWKSSDESVATVNGNGVATGVSSGKAWIAASADSKSGVATLFVTSTGAAQLIAASGGGQSASVNATLPQPLVAIVRDGQGRGVPNMSVNWAVTSGGGSVSTDVTTTDSNGRTSVQWTLGPNSGTQRVAATAAGLQPANFVASASAGGAARVQLTPTSLALQIGQIRTLNAVLLDAQGNPVKGANFTWTTSNASVAIVDDGQVRGAGTGVAVITARSGSVSGTASVTVGSSVSRVTLSSPVSQVSAFGEVFGLSASAFNASGTKISGVAFQWSSSNSSVLSVSGVGQATSRANGQSWLKACAGNACDSVQVGVAQKLSKVQISPSSPSVAMGGQLQLNAQAQDKNGNAVTGASLSWSSGTPAVASVSGSGMVSGLKSGTTTVTASASHGSAGSASGQVTVNVAGGSTPPPPPPPPPSGSVPQLPQAYVQTSYQAPNGRQIRVRQGDDLQVAINQAQRGDILLLDPGATFTGNFRLPAKSGSGWIVITTNTSLPSQGTRVTPSSASNFARIMTDNTAPALWVLAGSSQYRIMGVEIGVSTSAPFNYGIVRLGETGSAQNTLSRVPSNIILDRVYVHGATNKPTKRCVEMNASPAAVVDSWLAECHYNGQDAQAILAWNAPGPFKIVNNHLEGSGETVMFGGADPSISGLIPSDIEIKHNHFFRPPSWRGQWTVKNHFELKMARRVLFEGNIVENNWKDAQTGFVVVIKSANQGGGAPWAVTEHVTMRYNVFRNVANGINISAAASGKASGTTNNVLIAHNVLERLGPKSSFGGDGILFQVLDPMTNIRIENNTGFAERAALIFAGSTGIPGFQFNNNIVTRGQFGIFGSGHGEGTSALNAYTTSHSFSGNVIVGAPAGMYPSSSGNAYPGNVSQVGFVNVGAGDYRLSGSSPYQGRGADIGSVNGATAGAN